MKTKRARAPQWNAAQRARHKAIREEVANDATQEELQASGAYEGPIKSGAYFSVRILVHELRKVREEAGLTLAAVARCTGMDQATLSRLENGRQANPTVDTLSRYAHAVGRQLVLTHAAATAEPVRTRARRPARP
jgi:DNA-binding XRE family transcriptional regulator